MSGVLVVLLLLLMLVLVAVAAEGDDGAGLDGEEKRKRVRVLFLGLEGVMFCWAGSSLSESESTMARLRRFAGGAIAGVVLSEGYVALVCVDCAWMEGFCLWCVPQWLWFKGGCWRLDLLDFWGQDAPMEGVCQATGGELRGAFVQLRCRG